MKKRSTWKPVQLSGDLVSKGVEGLVGIEELCSYSLVSGTDVQTKKSDKFNNIDKKKIRGNSKNLARKRKKQKGKDSNEPLPKEIKVDKYFAKEDVTEFCEEGNKTFKRDDPVEMDRMTELHEKMSAWNELGIPESILRALSEEGFKEPTVIQVRTLPAAIMGKRDILGSAETGSGKTLAFGIPILCHILEDKRCNATQTEFIQHGTDNKEEDEPVVEDEDEEETVGNDIVDLGCVQVINNIAMPLENNMEMSNFLDRKWYALILTPTRELAIQIEKHLRAVAKYTGIKIAVVVGGMSVQKQERLLSHGPEIVVATPGRLWEMIQNGNCHLAQIGNIRYLAVDETDRMLEKGHFQELQNLLELLNVDEKKKEKRQNFVFSATLTMVHDPPRHLKRQKNKLKITPGQKLQSMMTVLGITNPKVIDITNDSGTAGTLTEARIMCTLEEKDFYLYYFLQRHQGRTLIFCNSISCVRRLAQLLTLLKCNPLPLHANMVQRQRLKNLDRFRDNPNGVLLATDVAARGLDIPNVQHVVHYQVPRTSESYVHRSGRTARARKQGLTLLLIEPTEAQYYVRVCRTLGRSKDLPLFPVVSNALDVAKKRVVLAREIDRLELASRRSTSETGWFRKTLSDMDMLVDEEDVPKQLDEDECNRNRRLAATKKKQLDSLLSKPLFVSNVKSDAIESLSTVKKNNVFVKRKQKKKRRKNKE